MTKTSFYGENARDLAERFNLKGPGQIRITSAVITARRRQCTGRIIIDIEV